MDPRMSYGNLSTGNASLRVVEEEVEEEDELAHQQHLVSPRHHQDHQHHQDDQADGNEHDDDEDMEEEDYSNDEVEDDDEDVHQTTGRGGGGSARPVGSTGGINIGGILRNNAGAYAQQQHHQQHPQQHRYHEAGDDDDDEEDYENETDDEEGEEGEEETQPQHPSRYNTHSSSSGGVPQSRMLQAATAPSAGQAQTQQQLLQHQQQLARLQHQQNLQQHYQQELRESSSSQQIAQHLHRMALLDQARFSGSGAGGGTGAVPEPSRRTPSSRVTPTNSQYSASVSGHSSPELPSSVQQQQYSYQQQVREAMVMAELAAAQQQHQQRTANMPIPNNVPPLSGNAINALTSGAGSSSSTRSSGDGHPSGAPGAGGGAWMQQQHQTQQFLQHQQQLQAQAVAGMDPNVNSTLDSIDTGSDGVRSGREMVANGGNGAPAYHQYHGADEDEDDEEDEDEPTGGAVGAVGVPPGAADGTYDPEDAAGADGQQPQQFVMDDGEDYEPTEQEVKEYCDWLGLNCATERQLIWIAREALKAPLPENWKICYTDEGEIYYFNVRTGESIWDHPMDAYYKALFKQEKVKLDQKKKHMRLFSGSMDIVPIADFFSDYDDCEDDAEDEPWKAAPETLIDAIDFRIYVQPVVLPTSGRTVSRHTIINNKWRDPFSREYVENRRLVPNVDKRCEVDNWLTKMVTMYLDKVNVSALGMTRLIKLLPYLLDKEEEVCVRAQHKLLAWVKKNLVPPQAPKVALKTSASATPPGTPPPGGDSPGRSTTTTTSSSKRVPSGQSSSVRSTSNSKRNTDSPRRDSSALSRTAHSRTTSTSAATQKSSVGSKAGGTNAKTGAPTRSASNNTRKDTMGSTSNLRQSVDGSLKPGTESAGPPAPPPPTLAELLFALSLEWRGGAEGSGGTASEAKTSVSNLLGSLLTMSSSSSREMLLMVLSIVPVFAKHECFLNFNEEVLNVLHLSQLDLSRIAAGLISSPVPEQEVGDTSTGPVASLHVSNDDHLVALLWMVRLKEIMNINVLSKMDFVAAEHLVLAAFSAATRAAASPPSATDSVLALSLTVVGGEVLSEEDAQCKQAGVLFSLLQGIQGWPTKLMACPEDHVRLLLDLALALGGTRTSPSRSSPTPRPKVTGSVSEKVYQKMVSQLSALYEVSIYSAERSLDRLAPHQAALSHLLLSISAATMERSRLRAIKRGASKAESRRPMESSGSVEASKTVVASAAAGGSPTKKKNGAEASTVVPPTLAACDDVDDDTEEDPSVPSGESILTDAARFAGILVFHNIIELSHLDSDPELIIRVCINLIPRLTRSQWRPRHFHATVSFIIDVVEAYPLLAGGILGAQSVLTLIKELSKKKNIGDDVRAKLDAVEASERQLQQSSALNSWTKLVARLKCRQEGLALDEIESSDVTTTHELMPTTTAPEKKSTLGAGSNKKKTGTTASVAGDVTPTEPTTPVTGNPRELPPANAPAPTAGGPGNGKQSSGRKPPSTKLPQLSPPKRQQQTAPINRTPLKGGGSSSASPPPPSAAGVGSPAPPPPPAATGGLGDVPVPQPLAPRGPGGASSARKGTPDVTEKNLTMPQWVKKCTQRRDEVKRQRAANIITALTTLMSMRLKPKAAPPPPRANVGTSSSGKHAPPSGPSRDSIKTASGGSVSTPGRGDRRTTPPVGTPLGPRTSSGANIDNASMSMSSTAVPPSVMLGGPSSSSTSGGAGSVSLPPI